MWSTGIGRLGRDSIPITSAKQGDLRDLTLWFLMSPCFPQAFNLPLKSKNPTCRVPSIGRRGGLFLTSHATSQTETEARGTTSKLTSLLLVP